MTERRHCALVSAALASAAVVLVAGCGSVVSGTARPAEKGVASRPLGELLLEPAAFPPAYPAVVLPTQPFRRRRPTSPG